MASKHSVSYLRQISAVQNIVTAQLARVQALEKNLKKRNLSEDERRLKQAELADIKEDILRKEEELKSYYGENRKSFMFAVFLMFFSFLIYVVYIMIVGPNGPIKPVKLT